MDTLIIEASRNIKKRRKKPSYDMIYNAILQTEGEVDSDVYKECFDELLLKGIMVNIKPNEENGSYHIVDDIPVDTGDTEETEDSRIFVILDKYKENDVFGIIKNVMLNEKVSTGKNLKHLEEEIIFLRNELIKKNDVIDKLVDMVNLKKPKVNTTIETSSQTNFKNASNSIVEIDNNCESPSTYR